MQWLFLTVAVLFEVGGTLCLRVASGGKRVLYVAVGVGYVVAFAFLSLALAQGLPLGVAYGIWTAAGVALTAVASKVLFSEPLTPVMVAGIALVIGGVLFVELGAAR